MSRRKRRSSAGRDVLIAGGGNSGTALAVALAAADFNVTLIEPRPPAPSPDNADVGLRVSALGPGSRHFLERLRAWPENDRRGPTAYREMSVCDTTGLGDLTFHAHQHSLSALGWIVDNQQLQQQLWRAAADAGVTLLGEHAVSGVQQNSRGVTVTLGDQRQLRADLLVAADGARSPLRGLLGIEVNESDYGQRAVVCTVTTAAANPGIAWQRFLPGGPLALLPVSEGRSSLVWSLPAEQAEDCLAQDEAAFSQQLSLAADSPFGAVVHCGPRAAFPLSMMLAGRYVEQRCVLLGDAAHRVHPLAGQGLNLGLQDAAALAELLIDAGGIPAEPQSLQRLLRRYERWRRSDDELVIRGVDAIGRMLRGEGLLPRISALGMRTVDHFWPLKDVFLRWACGLGEQAPRGFRQAAVDDA
ncbi:MAG: UbiH/UbiF family hydroxylase [Wenzhouxiangellaceae bacterium]